MKRRVLCIFGLIFWLLGLATFLSLRIEQLMTPLVTVTEPAHPNNSTEGRLPLDCLFDGQLFQTYEGTGWEQGTRVRLADPAQYQVMEDHIEMGWGKVVEYATKTPRPGEIVEVVLTPSRADDEWVVIPSDDRPLPDFVDFDPALTVEERAENALLVSVKNLPQPYMEKRARSMMPLAPVPDDFSPWMDESGEVDWEAVDWDALLAARPQAPNVYSLNDLEQLLGELPNLGLLAGIVLCALILWAGCWRLSRHGGQNRAGLIVLAGCMAALLVGAAFLIRSIDLPSSLLPVNNILEIGHYRQEFDQIFRALEIFSAGGSATAQSVLRQTWKELLLGGGIVAGSILLGAGIVLLETRRTQKSEKREKHAGW